MLNSLLAGITAFSVSFAFLPFIIEFSKQKKLGDAPGRRKIHKRITPSLGGAAIFLGFTIACICWTNQNKSFDTFFLLSVLIIPFTIGFLDDLVHLKPIAKLIAQAITASLIFFVLDIRLTSSYGLFGDQHFPVTIAFFITLLTVVVITNSLNLIDGIDGLAATFSFIAVTLFGAWFFLVSDYQFAILCFALSGGILAFLFQNWEPSKIFMGDTGSLVIGTLLSVVMIQFVNENHALDDLHQFKFRSSIGTAMCVLIIPLVDTTRIIIIRLFKKVSVFTPDKRHIHHALVRLNLSHHQSVYILTIVHVSIIAIAILMRKTNEWYLIGSVIGITTTLCLILDRFLAKGVQKEGLSRNLIGRIKP